MRLMTLLAGGLLLAGVVGADAAAQPSKRLTGIAAYYDVNYKGRTASGVP